MSLLITRRSPLADVRRINDVLDQAFNGWPFSNGSRDLVASAWVPATDIVEEADGVRLALELPGLKPEDVKITLENSVLTVRGEKKQTTEEKGKIYRYERSYGAFERSFTLPNTVDPEGVIAKFANGVLTVWVPKAEQAKPREIQVQVN